MRNQISNQIGLSHTLMVCQGPVGFDVNSLAPSLLPVIAHGDFLPRGMIGVLQDEESAEDTGRSGQLMAGARCNKDPLVRRTRFVRSPFS